MRDPHSRAVEFGTRLVLDGFDEIPPGMTHFRVDSCAHEVKYGQGGGKRGTLTIEYTLDVAQPPMPQPPEPVCCHTLRDCTLSCQSGSGCYCERRIQ